jgi:ParB-like chromosome segregation protein Spo0J
VSGRHRVEAAKQLKWKNVSAIVIDASKSEAETFDGVENIYRTELSRLYRAIAINNLRKAVIAKAENGEKVAGGQQPGDLGIKKLARILGLDKADIRRAMKISKIKPDARAEIVKQQLDEKQNVLLTIAKEATLALLWQI